MNNGADTLEGDPTLESVRKAQREEEDAQRLRSSDENKVRAYV